MKYAVTSFILLGIAIVAVLVARRFFNKDFGAQRQLDRYLRRSLSTDEIGLFYERYIGYLYENKGYEVTYNGALNGYADLGRDLIARHVDEVLIIQTKCWSRKRLIQEKHIFQLFGTMTHFRLTQAKTGQSTKAVFYTTAKYGDVARNVARVLGVELRTEELSRAYPMVKCCVSFEGERLYYLPFDDGYDKIRINYYKDECFVRTVKEAVTKGFRRAG